MDWLQLAQHALSESTPPTAYSSLQCGDDSGQHQPFIAYCSQPSPAVSCQFETSRPVCAQSIRSPGPSVRSSPSSPETLTARATISTTTTATRPPRACVTNFDETRLPQMRTPIASVHHAPEPIIPSSTPLPMSRDGGGAVGSVHMELPIGGVGSRGSVFAPGAIFVVGQCWPVFSTRSAVARYPVS